MMTTITIDRDNCISCGMCWDTCPEVYEQNAADSQSQILSSWQVAGNPAEGSVGEELAECAREGASVCPVSVISVT